MKKIHYRGYDYTCPFTETFRRHAATEVEMMAESIADFGILHEVMIYHDTTLGIEKCVLDGQGRLEAAVAVKVKVPFKDCGKMTTDEAFAMAKQHNDPRRHDSPVAVRKRRRQNVAELRAKGESIRVIAEVVGAPKTTVKHDLEAIEAAGVPTGTPESAKTRGKDGKTYPKKSKTPKKPKREKPPTGEVTTPPAVDGWGIPIQPHAVEAFAAVPAFRELAYTLRHARRMMSDLAESVGGRHLQRRCQYVRSTNKDGGAWHLASLDEAIHLIEDMVPTYTTCPYSHNPERAHPEKCNACGGVQWCPKLSRDIPTDFIANAKKSLGA